MAKLFKVTCVLTYVTAEENIEDARGNVTLYAREHLNDAASPFDSVHISEITSSDQIPKGWKGAIPYGDASDGDLPVKSYLN